jgi:hypothetical protein
VTALHDPGSRPPTAKVFPVSPRVPARTAAPPPRPALTTDLAPPLRRSRPPGRLRAGLLSALPWFAALVAAVTGSAATAADGTAIRARLTEQAMAHDPSVSAQLASSGVRTTLLLVLGAQLFLAVVGVLGAVLVLGHRGWARWALLATGVVTLPAVAFAQSVVAGGVDVDRIAFLAQGGLVLLGAAAVLSRPVGRWVHRRP